MISRAIDCERIDASSFCCASRATKRASSTALISSGPQPERVDDRSRLPIAKVQPGEPFPIALESDAARKLLIDGNRGQRDGLTHGHVLLPGLERLRLAAIRNALILVFHDAGLQCDDGIR